MSAARAATRPFMTDSPVAARLRRLLARPRRQSDPRARMLANVEGTPSPELIALLEQPGRAASVLIAVVERAGGHTVLFTERAAHLKDHAGQISFPGGRLAPGETAVAAALREAEEEVGLAPAHVDVLGTLEEHWTGTGFTVTPVVGYVTAPFDPKPDPLEVASVFEVPFEYLLQPDNCRVVRRERLGTRFRSFELHYGGHRIWGATAAMLVSFRDMILHDESTG